MLLTTDLATKNREKPQKLKRCTKTVEYQYPKTFYNKAYGEFDLSGVYFKKIIHEIANFINSSGRENLTVLDFGCGEGYLKKYCNEKKFSHKIVNYDVIQENSEVKEWQGVRFDVFVANHVFCLFTETELEDIIQKIKQINPNVEMIVGVCRAGLVNSICKTLANQKNAHSYNRINATEEISILEKNFKPIGRKNVFFMTDVYKLK